MSLPLSLICLSGSTVQWKEMKDCMGLRGEPLVFSFTQLRETGRRVSVKCAPFEQMRTSSFTEI